MGRFHIQLHTDVPKPRYRIYFKANGGIISPMCNNFEIAHAHPLITSSNREVFILTSPKYKFGPKSMAPKGRKFPPAIRGVYSRIRAWMRVGRRSARPPVVSPAIMAARSPQITIPDPVLYRGELAHGFRILANCPDFSAHIRKIAHLNRDSIGIVAPTLLIECLARGIRNAGRTDPITV